MGVWIETPSIIEMAATAASHPSWVCGLKLTMSRMFQQLKRVTPFVGVWIETVYVPPVGEELQVTPFVGVWIETRKSAKN